MFGISQKELLNGVEIPESLVRSFERHRELLQRTLDAERERDEATARADALRAELDRQSAEHEASYTRARAEIAEPTKKMNRLEQELQASAASLDAARVKHEQAINKLTMEYLQAVGQLVAVRKRAEELERHLAAERAAKEATKGLALFTGIVGMRIGAWGRREGDGGPGCWQSRSSAPVASSGAVVANHPQSKKQLKALSGAR